MTPPSRPHISRPRRRDALASQLDAYLTERRKDVPLTVRCHLDDCGWAYTGGTAQALTQHAQHRQQAHPQHQPRTRRQLQADWRKQRTRSDAA